MHVCGADLAANLGCSEAQTESGRPPWGQVAALHLSAPTSPCPGLSSVPEEGLSCSFSQGFLHWGWGWGWGEVGRRKRTCSDLKHQEVAPDLGRFKTYMEQLQSQSQNFPWPGPSLAQPSLG